MMLLFWLQFPIGQRKINTNFPSHFTLFTIKETPNTNLPMTNCVVIKAKWQCYLMSNYNSIWSNPFWLDLRDNNQLMWSGLCLPYCPSSKLQIANFQHTKKRGSFSFRFGWWRGRRVSTLGAGEGMLSAQLWCKQCHKLENSEQHSYTAPFTVSVGFGANRIKSRVPLLMRAVEEAQMDQSEPQQCELYTAQQIYFPLTTCWCQCCYSLVFVFQTTFHIIVWTVARCGSVFLWRWWFLMVQRRW